MSRGINHEHAWAAMPPGDHHPDDPEDAEERGPPESEECMPFEPIEALCAEESPESQLTE